MADGENERLLGRVVDALARGGGNDGDDAYGYLGKYCSVQVDKGIAKWGAESGSSEESACVLLDDVGALLRDLPLKSKKFKEWIPSEETLLGAIRAAECAAPNSRGANAVTGVKLKQVLGAFRHLALDASSAKPVPRARAEPTLADAMENDSTTDGKKSDRSQMIVQEVDSSFEEPVAASGAKIGVSSRDTKVSQGDNKGKDEMPHTHVADTKVATDDSPQNANEEASSNKAAEAQATEEASTENIDEEEDIEEILPGDDVAGEETEHTGVNAAEATAPQLDPNDAEKNSKEIIDEEVSSHSAVYSKVDELPRREEELTESDKAQQLDASSSDKYISEKTRMDALCAALEARVESLQQENLTLSKSLESAASNTESEMSALTTQIKTLEEKLENARAAESDLGNKNQSLSGKLIECAAENKTLEVRIAELEAECARHRESHSGGSAFEDYLHFKNAYSISQAENERLYAVVRDISEEYRLVMDALAIARLDVEQLQQNANKEKEKSRALAWEIARLQAS